MNKLLYLLLFSFISILCSAQNYGIQISGTNSEIQLCHSEDFNVGSNFTVEAWIYAVNWKAESWQGTIISKDYQNSTTTGFVLRAGKEGTLSFALGNGSWPELKTEPFMNEDQWYHVAAVKEGSSVRLFINGQLAASSTITGEPNHNTGILKIGESAGFPGRDWDGFLDEIRIWNVARTAQELIDNQTTEFNGNEPGLVAYLPMNEGSGNTSANLSDSNCNANLINLNNSSWVEGYSIPGEDIGIVNISAPDVVSIFQKPVKIRAEIQNFGLEEISNIPVQVSIDETVAFTQNFNITIQPGEVVEVIFDQIIDLSDSESTSLSLSTMHPNDGNALNDSHVVDYKKSDNENMVTILDRTQFNFSDAGQTQFTIMNLPENTEDYEQLLLHISVECPSTGCDPWDQPAKISVNTDQGSHEIARFVTPFGIGCGNWTVDVTDFKSILRGNVTFQSFVQVWGPSGWLTTVELEYVRGDEPSYNIFTPLWENNYLVYGDPAISHDLEEQSISLNKNTESNHIRMTMSGHGQGNTDNAAEFSDRTHTFYLNGQNFAPHKLWKTDCPQNECANQLGTWLFSRAGWCPGQAVEPFIVNTTGVVAAGENLNIDYVLEDYTNLLNTGYNNAGHTEPHYRIFSYFVETSKNRFVDYRNLKADNINIVSNGDINNPAIESLDFTISNTGNIDMSNFNISYWVNEEFISEQTVATSIAAGESQTISFSNISGFDFGTDNEVIAVINAVGDENLNDDAAKANFNNNTVSVAEIELAEVQLSPNPSSGIIYMDVEDAFINGNLRVIDILGREVKVQKILSPNSKIELTETGVYFFNFVTTNGTHRTERVIVE